MPPLTDTFDRPLRSLRVSVTDRCNLRCGYCMPEADYEWLPKSDLLDFEEMSRWIGAFSRQGVDRVRLTGGEPLLRRELPTLIRMIREVAGIRDLAMTTNGVLLSDQAEALLAAGLTRVTISLDTLQPERARILTGRNQLARVLAGLDAVSELGFESVKWNTVLVRGRNDDEVESLLRAAGERGAELRFIEYMDVGGATRWNRDDVVSKASLLAEIDSIFGEVESVATDASAPARRYRLPNGQVFGIIASTTEPFCRSCDRARLTADGQFFTCLYARQGFDLRGAIRSGVTDDELDQMLTGIWSRRSDRGAEERLALRDARGPLAGAEELERDPHLEMHTRGG
ncbi:MAG: GTP 3',8-cyclase MoaA [Planctomycetota bacterium]